MELVPSMPIMILVGVSFSTAVAFSFIRKAR
jgi:hypothetical protein